MVKQNVHIAAGQHAHAALCLLDAARELLTMAESTARDPQLQRFVFRTNRAIQHQMQLQLKRLDQADAATQRRR